MSRIPKKPASKETEYDSIHTHTGWHPLSGD